MNPNPLGTPGRGPGADPRSLRELQMLPEQIPGPSQTTGQSQNPPGTLSSPPKRNPNPLGGVLEQIPVPSSTDNSLQSQDPLGIMPRDPLGGSSSSPPRGSRGVPVSRRGWGLSPWGHRCRNSSVPGVTIPPFPMPQFLRSRCPTLVPRGHRASRPPRPGRRHGRSAAVTAT